MWLTFKIFGSGYGLGAPFWEQSFYWIPENGPGGRGRFYTWIGGFGAQLSSFEWLSPRAGTRRHLLGKEFVIFQTSRRGLLVSCSWAVTDNITDYSEIAAIKKMLP